MNLHILNYFFKLLLCSKTNDKMKLVCVNNNVFAGYDFYGHKPRF